MKRIEKRADGIYDVYDESDYGEPLSVREVIKYLFYYGLIVIFVFCIFMPHLSPLILKPLSWILMLLNELCEFMFSLL